MTDKKITLDPRLSAAASFVGENAVLADIGTDHAYLPVYLLTCGKIKKAVASDINKGPLERAVQNAEKYGVESDMIFTLCDGIPDAVSEDNKVSDIVICGMGGELIEKIISASAYAKSGVKLILGPMTHTSDLRKYLLHNGFSITDEVVIEASSRLYAVMTAEYTGASCKSDYSDAEMYIGRHIINRGGEPALKYAQKNADKLRTQIRGKRSGALDCSEEEKLLCEIEKIITELEVRL